MRDEANYPGDEAAENFIRWNIENVLLPKLTAFNNACQEMPMTDGDYEILKNNRMFMRTLLKGAARAWLRKPHSGNFVVCLGRPMRAWRPSRQDRPLVSVILPVANDEIPVVRTVKSILGQNSMPDFELLIVNNNSQDNSLTFCERLALKDDRIRILSSVEERPLWAGVAAAAGKYIAFAHARGIMAPDFLLAASKWLETTPSAGAATFAIAAKEDFSDIKPDLPESAKILRIQAVVALDGVKTPKLYGTLWRSENLKSLAQQSIYPDSAEFALAAFSQMEEMVLDSSSGWSDCASAPKEVDKISKALATQAWLEANTPNLSGKAPVFQALAKQITMNFIHILLAYIYRNRKNPGVPLSGRQIALLCSLPKTLAAMLSYCADMFGKTEQSSELLSCPAPSSPEPIASLIGKVVARKTPYLSLIIYARNINEKSPEYLRDFLAKAVDTLEIIIIDDSSENESVEWLMNIMAELKKRSMPITTQLHQMCHHVGRAVAWNFGLANASGAYVYFTDMEASFPSWLSGIGMKELNDSDMALAQSVESDWRETMSLCLHGECGAPIFSREFLKNNDIKFSDIEWPQLPHLALALSRAESISKLPYYAEKFPLIKIGENGYWRFESALKLQKIMNCLLEDTTQTLRMAWADWLLAPQNGFMDVILSHIKADPEVLDNFEWQGKFFRDEYQMQAILKYLALINHEAHDGVA